MRLLFRAKPKRTAATRDRQQRKVVDEERGKQIEFLFSAR